MKPFFLPSPELKTKHVPWQCWSIEGREGLNVKTQRKATSTSVAMLAESHCHFAMTSGLWKKKNKPYREERGSRFSSSTAENPIAPCKFPSLSNVDGFWMDFAPLLAFLRHFIVR